MHILTLQLQVELRPLHLINCIGIFYSQDRYLFLLSMHMCLLKESFSERRFLTGRTNNHCNGTPIYFDSALLQKSIECVLHTNPVDLQQDFKFNSWNFNG